MCFFKVGAVRRPRLVGVNMTLSEEDVSKERRIRRLGRLMIAAFARGKRGLAVRLLAAQTQALKSRSDAAVQFIEAQRGL